MRELATRETIAESSEWLFGHTEVLPEPVAEQRRLEGELFLELRYLHAPSYSAPARTDEFSFHRLRPRSDSIEIIADRLTATRAIIRALPVDIDEELCGLPGVRLATTTDGVALRRLRTRGEIRFPAVTEGDVLREVARNRASGMTYLQWSSPERLAPRELDLIENSRGLSDHIVDAASAVARRVGVLINHGTTSIDMWTSADPDQLCVEARFDGIQHLTDQMLENFASPAYEPRLSQLVHDRLYPPAHHPFRIGRALIDLRLRVHASDSAHG
ncbi:hypothetical protein AB2L57_09365 [Microbacterium sp. HA-8]|uniref:hypothetical protein n=1 Tax=Microbacterium sp. HA-8 TaxID=3234200 RepID=UPI0038F6B26B